MLIQLPSRRRHLAAEVSRVRESGRPRLRVFQARIGPGKLMPFLVRKKSPKRASNPLSFGPQIRNLGQGRHVIFPKKEISHEFNSFDNPRLPKESHLQMKRAPMPVMPAARSSPSMTLYGTSKFLCSVAPSNPLFVDKPAVQIA